LKSWTQTADALKGNCLYSTFHIEKPTALLSLSNVNKGRKEINKCKELKIKWNFKASKAITGILIKKKITSLGNEPQSPVSQANMLPSELSLTMPVYCVSQRNSGVSTPDILARNSEVGPLSYCRTRAELQGFNWPGSLVRICMYMCVCAKSNIIVILSYTSDVLFLQPAIMNAMMVTDSIRGFL
jgi:hypothetical protein